MTDDVVHGGKQGQCEGQNKDLASNSNIHMSDLPIPAKYHFSK